MIPSQTSIQIEPNSYLHALVPYVPGKPIEETQREFGLKKVVKLASNENPLGPSPRAVLALRREVQQLHRYPDASAYHLKRALAQQLSVLPENLVLGNGSEEVMDLVLRALSAPGDEAITSDAAFIAYSISAQIQGVKMRVTPLTSDGRFDLEKMAVEIERNPRIKTVWIANPNNPTGTYVTQSEMEKFLDRISRLSSRSVLVVLDSAYLEFVTAKDFPDPHELQKKYPFVLILRTFSKIYGLAGLRIGYGVGAPQVVAHLQQVRKPFNSNSLALAAAQAALGDRAFVKRTLSLNQKSLRDWTSWLKKWQIPFYPTQANFILANVKKSLGCSGAEFAQSLLQRGVIVRPVANYGLVDWVRISMGTLPENAFAAKHIQKVVEDFKKGELKKGDRK